jgi:hypothetical protein
MVGSGARESNTLPKGDIIPHNSTKAAHDRIVESAAETVIVGVGSSSCAIAVDAKHPNAAIAAIASAWIMVEMQREYPG